MKTYKFEVEAFWWDGQSRHEVNDEVEAVSPLEAANMVSWGLTQTAIVDSDPCFPNNHLGLIIVRPKGCEEPRWRFVPAAWFRDWDGSMLTGVRP